MADKHLEGSSNKNDNNPGTPGVLGESTIFNGVLGMTTADGHAGVAGVCYSGKSNGVYGGSNLANGVYGVTIADNQAGVAGVCLQGKSNGVYGGSNHANGVLGSTIADGHAGVAGICDDGKGNGVYGRSKNANGVLGFTNSDAHAGVAGACDEGKGNGVYGRSKNGFAGFFEGKVTVTGDLTVKGISILALIQTILKLQGDISQLQAKSDSTAHSSQSSTPQIKVTVDAANKFVVAGSGFLPNTLVTIHSGYDYEILFSPGVFKVSSDNSGAFETRITSIACNAGSSYHFRATDNRPDKNNILEQVLWSNVATVVCN